jgi:hypothetical protein
LPLADDIDAIADCIQNYSKGQETLLILDSLGPAVGGDLNKTGAPMDFFKALRKLNCSSLVIGHTSKGNELGNENAPKTIYGNAFFDFLGRNNWEVKAGQESGSNVLTVGLFHRKHNLIGKQPPRGYTIIFERDQTMLSPVSVEDTDLICNLPLKDQISHALGDGPKTTKELAEEVGKSEAVIRTTCSRWRGIFNRTGDTWELAASVTV